jgi:hypothetical protein
MNAKDHISVVRHNIIICETVLQESRNVCMGRHSHRMNISKERLGLLIKKLKKKSMKNVTMKELGEAGTLRMSLLDCMWMLKEGF